MSGPDSGTYSIQLAAEPKPYIGVDGGGPTNPIVTDAKYRTWDAVEFQNGTYRLIVEEGDARLHAWHDGDGKVVTGGHGDVEAAATPWVKIVPDSGATYRIQSSDATWPPLVWTVSDPNVSGSPVLLRPLDLEHSHENQAWYFRSH